MSCAIDYKHKYFKYMSKLNELNVVQSGGQSTHLKSISIIIDTIKQKTTKSKDGESYERSFSSKKKRLTGDIVINVTDKNTWKDFVDELHKKIKVKTDGAKLSILIFRKQFGKTQKGEDKKIISSDKLNNNVDIDISTKYPYVTIVYKSK